MKRFQQLHPEGCITTRLNQRLGWQSKDTMGVIDDLDLSGMICGDCVSSWAQSHIKGRLPKSGGYLLKVSPWGDEFLSHWEELNKLSKARNHHYSELECDSEQEKKRRTT
jgi:hypothetical protein